MLPVEVVLNDKNRSLSIYQTSYLKGEGVWYNCILKAIYRAAAFKVGMADIFHLFFSLHESVSL